MTDKRTKKSQQQSETGEENIDKSQQKRAVENISLNRRRKRKSSDVVVRASYMAKRLRDMRKNETPEQREARLLDMKERARKRIANETSEQREARLAQLRDLAKKRIAADKSRRYRLEAILDN